MSGHAASHPFYKRAWFIGLSSVATLVGTAIGIVAVFWRPDPPLPPFENVEIILDRSAGMAQTFDGTTKLEAAVQAVDLVMRTKAIEHENLAFREFGGPCNPSETALTLPFSQHNADRIRDKMRALKASGEANLNHSILQAIHDFGSIPPSQDTVKEIIVITGTAACDSPELVHAELETVKSKIKLDFHFVGVGLDDIGQMQLAALAHQTDGTANFAGTRQQLEDEIRGLVEVAPVVQGGHALLEILNASVDRLNPVIEDINRRDYTAGGRDLEQVRVEYHRSELPFQDLAHHQTKTEYRDIFETASQGRELQSRLISVVQQMLSDSKGSQGPSQELSASFDEIRSKYNEEAATLTGRLNSLRPLMR